VLLLQQGLGYSWFHSVSWSGFKGVELQGTEWFSDRLVGCKKSFKQLQQLQREHWVGLVGLCAHAAMKRREAYKWPESAAAVAAAGGAAAVAIRCAMKQQPVALQALLGKGGMA
jgi:hypothetical protein